MNILGALAGLPALAFLILGGCMGGGGSGSETMDGKLTGRLVYKDGSPVSGAAVLARPATFLTDTSEAGEPHFRPDAFSGEDGEFEIPTPDSGALVLEILDGLGNSLLVTCESPGRLSSLHLAVDTLKPSGRLEGTARRDARETGRIYARLQGLDRIELADSAGAFAFNDLPSGHYRMVLTSATPGTGYADQGSIQVTSGDTTRLDTVPRVTFGGEDYATWVHSRRIFLAAAAAGLTGPVTDFPLLVRLDKSAFDFSRARGNGGDIRFADNAGTHLPFEIEDWNAEAGTASIWVLVPEVKAADGDAGIRMFWGKPDAAEMSSGSAVFQPSNGFAGVWHFANSLKDATANGNHGTNAGTTNAAALIGNGRQFLRSRQDSAVVGYSPSLGLRGFTVSAWARPASPRKAIYGILGTRFGSDFTFDMKLNGMGAHADIGDGKAWLTNAADHGFSWTPDRWYHICYRVDQTGYQVFLDGVLGSEKSLSEGALLMKSIQTLTFGVAFTSPKASTVPDANEHFDGLLDEIRISSEIRSADWIKLGFENQKAGSTLVELRD